VLEGDTAGAGAEADTGDEETSLTVHRRGGCTGHLAGRLGGRTAAEGVGADWD
jgi:hypothetical protein